MPTHIITPTCPAPNDAPWSIDMSDCIGTSVQYMNKNTNYFECRINSLDEFVQSLIPGLIPSLMSIRVSFSTSAPVPTTNITDASILYVHPYKGNSVTLWDNTTNTWKIYPFTSKLTVPLVCPTANANYDIYLYRQSNNFLIEFVQWSNSNLGIAAPTRTYKDGIVVKSLTEPNKRLIGCLRTTGVNKSEQSFGGQIAGGAGPKQYLWNAQNQVPINLYSFELGSYYYAFYNPTNSNFPNYDTLYNTGTWRNTPWFRVGATPRTIEGVELGPGHLTPDLAPYDGTDNRFSFICGDLTSVGMIGQIYPNSTDSPDSRDLVLSHTDLFISYVSFGVNNENSPTFNEPMMVSELSFANQTPRCQLSKTFHSGYHYIQLFERLMYGGPQPTFWSIITMNEGHSNQTGFLATIYN